MIMNILIICCKFDLIDRPTINNHLYSFQRYGSDSRFFYLYLDSIGHIPDAVLDFPFDAVIFHYTFLAQRFSGAYFTRRYEAMLPKLKRLRGIKVMIPQDEYVYTEFLWQVAKDLSVDYIFTTYQQEAYSSVFPKEKVGNNARIYTVFPGYIEELVERRLQRKLKEHSERPIDVGYRAQTDRFIFGQHGHLKSELAQVFQQKILGDSEINADIQLITIEGVHAIKGEKWFDFLLDSRTMLGCLGGSSLFDPTGCFRERTLAYTEKHSDATYEEVERACYPDADWKVSNCSLGPKNFEYAMTKTCQVLMEGWYHGVFLPGEHYIEIKQDYSNVEDVIEKIKDREYCACIAQQCYEDIVLSGRYSYRQFVQDVLSRIQEKVPVSKKQEDVPNQKALNRMEATCIAQKIRICVFLCLRLTKGLFSRVLKNLAPTLHANLKKIYKKIVV